MMPAYHQQAEVLDASRPLLQVKGVCKTYRQRPPAVEVLHNISFSIAERQFVTLLGSSGCGKTTLLTLVAGFHQATSGTLIISGRPVAGPGPDRGFVFQNYALFPWLTVRQNLEYPMKERGLSRSERAKLCDALLSMARLNDARSLYPGQLSGGMKQRAAFIRALAGSPDILLLDEPLGAIDPQMRKGLQVELAQLWLQDRKTVLMVTHDMDEAVYLSDRILVMAPCGAAISRNQGTNLIEDIIVDLPRPRDRASRHYHRLLKSVEHCLEHIAAGADHSSSPEPKEISYESRLHLLNPKQPLHPQKHDRSPT
ncbi:ABC transporter ATP-binding protein [Desulfosarcina sp. OttesenSCG-928-B08]|nr:ABC transporter ATP-binding protein [Desulfosarcina sp. OttesenSCG-928-B08]